MMTTIPLILGMITLLSLNVNGLHTGGKINTFFGNTHADTICLQETW